MQTATETRGISYRCTHCGKTIIASEPPSLCPHCGMDGPEYGFPTVEAVKIAGQNDRFRAELLTGRASGLAGNIVITRGIANRSDEFITEAFLAVSRDCTFTPDNDPYGDHGFGTVTVQGEKLFWKIDLYDRDLVHGSPEPSDPSQTRRVLTIMFPAEY